MHIGYAITKSPHFVPVLMDIYPLYGSVVNPDNGKILISVTSNLTMHTAHTAFSFGEL